MELTQERVRELFEYRDGMLFWKIAPAANVKVGDRAGWYSDRYRQVSINGRTRNEHRIVFLWHHGFVPAKIDHADGNPHNNRAENLRAATMSQNQMNRVKRHPADSKYKGVTYCNDGKRLKRWVAYINLDGTRTHLGRYHTEEDAARAYNAAAIKLFGEFARPNIIENP